MLYLLQTALHGMAYMNLGELLTDLPSEVRVRIFCLALGLPPTLRRWLDLALVSQCLLWTPSGRSSHCAQLKPPCIVSTDMAHHCCAEAMGSPTSIVDADLLRPCSGL